MTLLGKSGVLLWHDVVAEARERFLRWHEREHLPARLTLPGFHRARRYRGQRAPFLVFFETDAEATGSPAYQAQAAAEPSDEEAALDPHFILDGRAVFTVRESRGRTGATHLTTVRYEEKLASEALFERWNQPGVTACHILDVTDYISPRGQTIETVVVIESAGPLDDLPSASDSYELDLSLRKAATSG